MKKYYCGYYGEFLDDLTDAQLESCPGSGCPECEVLETEEMPDGDG